MFSQKSKNKETWNNNRYVRFLNSSNIEHYIVYIFADIFFNSMILCLMTSGSEVSENTLLASDVIHLFLYVLQSQLKKSVIVRSADVRIY